MQDRQRYFEGQLTRNVAAEQQPGQPVVVRDAFSEMRRGLGSWETRLNQVCAPASVSVGWIISYFRHGLVAHTTKALRVCHTVHDAERDHTARCPGQEEYETMCSL